MLKISRRKSKRKPKGRRELETRTTGNQTNSGYLYGTLKAFAPIDLGEAAWLPSSETKRGLFSASNYKPGERIKPYAGEIKYISYDKLAPENAAYMFGTFTIRNYHCVIDGFREPRPGYGMGQFCNDKRQPTQKVHLLKKTLHRKILAPGSLPRDP